MKFTLTILIIFVFTTNLYSRECDETTIARMIKSGISNKTIEEQCGKLGEKEKVSENVKNEDTGAEPKWKIGQEATIDGIVLVVVGFSDEGEPLFKFKPVVKESVDENVEDLLQALRDELKKQGKEPCDTCYLMMDPGDPRIPVEEEVKQQ